MTQQIDKLSKSIDSVVDNDNCSGCGLCASLFQGVEMKLDAGGFLRPDPAGRKSIAAGPNDADLFSRICPGRVVGAATEKSIPVHPIFGPNLGVWEGWALDEDFRNAGSSGGALTAIAAHFQAKLGKPSRMVSMNENQPTRSVSVQITTRDQALRAAGSRYAPVSGATSKLDEYSTITAKPCEVSGMRALANEKSMNGPLLLSFFCAGTPSQSATNRIVTNLGQNPDSISALKYRGDGWPGRFSIVGKSGDVAEMSYSKSWGEVLGRDLQQRCKICVDGTGEHADIAVGDYWSTDEKGYPVFTEQLGRSVIIARTTKGRNAILECMDAGIIHGISINLDSVMPVQPLQVNRRITLPGRLLGRLVSGKKIPEYVGYELSVVFMKNIRVNIRSFIGTVRRSFSRRPKKSPKL